MRFLKPIRNSVVCKKVEGGDELVTDGVIFHRQTVDLYQIIDFQSEEEFPFKVGDVVMSCSTGDEIEINPKEIVYLFKTEHIMCRVENDTI